MMPYNPDPDAFYFHAATVIVLLVGVVGTALYLAFWPTLVVIGLLGGIFCLISVVAGWLKRMDS